MSSKLCNVCKIIHEWPWDDKCKTVNSPMENVISQWASNDSHSAGIRTQLHQATSPHESQPVDTPTALCKEIMNSVKGLQTQKSDYGVHLNDLSQKVSGSRDKVDRERDTQEKTVFGAQGGSFTKSQSATKHTPRQDVRPKTTSAALEAPPMQ